MRNTLVLIALASGLTACGTAGQKDIAPEQGLSSVHVPVVTKSQYALDIAAPYGELAPEDAGKLDGWFRGLNLGYGDSVYIDGPVAADTRSHIARIAGNYGMLVSAGTPITPGGVTPGMVRVVVSRARAEVPGCPDWSEKSQPNYSNRMMPNFGCGVNAALAAQVANPEDLIHGREGSGVGDAETAAKAVNLYRNWPLTAITEGQTARPLKDASTRKKEGN